MSFINWLKAPKNSTFLKGGGAKLLAAALILGGVPVSAQELTPLVLENNDLYSLTPVDKQGEDTITKFEYDEASGEFIPVYYRVKLNQTDFGYPDKNGGVEYFKYTNENGILKLIDGTADDYDISYWIDNDRVESQTILVENGAYGDINKDFINSSNDKNITIYGSKNNYSSIDNITGDFIGNTGIGISNGGKFVQDSYSKINNIKGNFINNKEVSIHNRAKIGTIEGNFIGNKATGLITTIDSGESGLGVILNNDGGTISRIKGNFIGNTSGAINQYSSYFGTAIGSITSNFIGNSITATNNNTAAGAAISNGNEITGTEADYIYHQQTYVITDGSGNQREKTYYYTTDSIGFMKSIDEVLAAIDDGATISTISERIPITQEEFEDIITGLEDDITDGFTTDTPLDIPITQFDTIEDAPIYNSTFIGNKVISENGEALGGAIYNSGTIGTYYLESAGIHNGIVNSSFYNNSAESGTDTAKGGAIYSAGDIEIIADNGQSIFSGNKVINNGVEKPNAIYMDTYETSEYDVALDNSVYTVVDSTLTLNTVNHGEIIIDDQIDGATESGYKYYWKPNYETLTSDLIVLEENKPNNYNIELNGDSTGKITFNNDVLNADISLNSGANTYLGRENVWDTSNVTLNGGTLSLLNNSVGTADFNSLSISADTKLFVDVDLENKIMDRISSDIYNERNGNIIVEDMNLLSDAKEDRTEIFFADNGLKYNVSDNGHELPSSAQTELYSPIYKYNAEYMIKDDGGYFLFTRNRGGSGNPSDDFNPAVLSTPVANLAAGQAAINEAFKYVFEHADAFTQLPSMERYAKINANKYALSTDFNNNMPDYSTYPDKGVWFRPYTTFESMNLKNGPDVDAITYGSLVGFDGDFKEMKNGWHRVFTGYAGYMGSSLNYSGVDTTMNGGLLGFTETFYKGNFWTAITASAGASVGESHSMYGKEDYTSLLAGVGSKTGYNFEFKDGKFIIQPIMFLSYTFVNTFDYKNAAGVNIESDPLHTIQLNPSVRFIANLKNGWQPYASVGMVWNLMNESKVTANNVKLPEMSVKPYVEYGVGIQRNWAEKYTGFLQAMIRNGGRNGIALTGGFRFMIGDETNNTPETPKKEIKSL